jgi:hypothetical protein
MPDQLLLGSFDPRGTIVREGDLPPADQSTADGRAPGSATVAEYRPDRVVVEVDATAPGYLVLSDRYDDAWRAKVNAQPAPLLRADAIFRAVPIQAGHSTVVFSYEPLNVLVGAAASLATAAGVAVALLWLALPGRRRRDGSGYRR